MLFAVSSRRELLCLFLLCSCLCVALYFIIIIVSKTRCGRWRMTKVSLSLSYNIGFYSSSFFQLLSWLKKANRRLLGDFDPKAHD